MHNPNDVRLWHLKSQESNACSLSRKGQPQSRSTNPSDSPEMVMGFYSNTYPEQTTATIHGPTMKDDAAVYEFKTTIGTKG